MSRVLVIFAHPSHDSYNFGVLQKAVDGLNERGHDVQVNDLYVAKFDPVLTEGEFYRKHTPEIILNEQAKVIWADLLFFIFPVWWWSPPAILKGWLERVLCQNFAFRYDVKVNATVGTLQDRRAVIISTSSSDPNSYPIRWQAASHTDFVREILTTSGLNVIKQMNFYEIHQYADQHQLSAHLDDVDNFVKTL
jgi:NAD(P)H dehydrogenase (quinone)